MKELGQVLQTTRESRHLTLDEIQERTKIRKRYLQAIEDGDLSILPGLVYARGFVKSYAEELGMDGQALLEAYGLLQEKPADEQAKDSPHSKLQPSVRKSAALLNQTTSKLPQVVMGIGIIGLLGIGYWVLTGWGKESALPQPTQQQTSPNPNNQPTPTAPVTPPQQEKPAEPLKPESKATGKSFYKVQADKLKVDIDVANDNCWLEIWVDDQQKISQLVTKGTLLSYEGAKIVIISGNAPALKVKVNDQPTELEQARERYEFHFQKQ